MLDSMKRVPQTAQQPQYYRMPDGSICAMPQAGAVYPGMAQHMPPGMPQNVPQSIPQSMPMPQSR